MTSDARETSLKKAALEYHEFPRPGKLEIRPTKPMANGRDLARAYSPGVAAACLFDRRLRGARARGRRWGLRSRPAMCHCHVVH